jgi:P4 family phage/plasmid primase-like protien
VITHDSRPQTEAAGAKLNLDTFSMTGPADKFFPDRTPNRAGLEPRHRQELYASAISDKVIDGRGYQSVLRTNTDLRHESLLKRNGIAKAVWSDMQRYPGMLMPQYSPTGELRPGLYKPDKPRYDDKGRPRKYEAPQGRPPVLDVHPFNRDRICDPTVPLWVTEGIKKGDALTTAGQCAISLSGVFNWRSSSGTLGDWEDVPLRGREVILCFDSDAATNRNVATAMRRLGRWLKSKGASVRYCIVPSPLGPQVKVGADDFLASGGSIQGLLIACVKQLPDLDQVDLELTDSRLAERVVRDELVGRFRYVRGLGWLEFTGQVWREVGDERVTEAVRLYLKDMLLDAVHANADPSKLQQMSKLQSRGRITAVTALTKGMDGVQAEVGDFDADPWLLNVGNGVLDLRTGELAQHAPEFLMRHFTKVAYIEGADHPDWDKALTALTDQDTTEFLQVFFGTGAVGIPPHEDLALFLQGGGSNGKSTILNPVQAALGTYAVPLLSSVLGGNRTEHPTELMDMLGARMVFMEETADGHRLDTTKLKKIIGTETITGHRMGKDSVSFSATHTAVFTTNHPPSVLDTDHGTWRRLAMVPFTKTYRREAPDADLLLRDRLIRGQAQQQAVLAWVVDGAKRWHEASCVLPSLPAVVEEATSEWRRSCDVIFDFVQDMLRSSPDGFVETEHLREQFNDWVKPPHLPWGKQKFGQRFEQHPAMQGLGAERGKHPSTRRAGFFGVAYKPD